MLNYNILDNEVHAFQQKITDQLSAALLLNPKYFPHKVLKVDNDLEEAGGIASSWLNRKACNRSCSFYRLNCRSILRLKAQLRSCEARLKASFSIRII